MGESGEERPPDCMIVWCDLHLLVAALQMPLLHSLPLTIFAPEPAAEKAVSMLRANQSVMASGIGMRGPLPMLKEQSGYSVQACHTARVMKGQRPASIGLHLYLCSSSCQTG